MSTANHPQTDGQTERANRTVIEMLRGYCLAKSASWDEHLIAMEFAINDSVNQSTGLTPFYFNSGQHPRVPPSLLASATSVQGSVNPLAESAFEGMRLDLQLARAQLLKAQQRMKVAADKLRRPAPTYAIGDLVMIASKTLRTPESDLPRHKLHPKFIGPFPVSAIISDHNYQVALPGYLKRVHPTFHVSVLKPYVDGSEEFPERDPIERVPFAVTPEGDALWVIEKLLRRRKNGRTVQFEVKWLGFDRPEDNTWEDRSRLVKDVPLLVEAFESS